jgi:hypothetical protein
VAGSRRCILYQILAAAACGAALFAAAPQWWLGRFADRN